MDWEDIATKIYINIYINCSVLAMLTFLIMCAWSDHVPFKFSSMNYKATVDSAVLAALHPVSSPPNTTSAVRYDLSVNLSLRNRGFFHSIWYREISAVALYNGSTMLGVPDRIAPTSGNGRAKNKASWQAKLQGTVAVRPSAAAELERERAAGTVHVQVRVSVSMARKTWPLVPIIYGSYDCWLWFPPPPAIFAQGGTKCFPVK